MCQTESTSHAYSEKTNVKMQMLPLIPLKNRGSPVWKVASLDGREEITFDIPSLA